MNANFYLKKLIIQNFATFRNQAVQFRPGFNAIIGETGSGKSLVLEALQLILGGRADKKTVRKDTEYSLVEATFYCDDAGIRNFLETEGYPMEGKELFIKRMIYKNGSTKTFVNHLTCTVGFLGNFAKKYIDLVGQFENQKLLSENYQLHLLDHFAKNQQKLADYQNAFHKLKTIQKKQLELEQNRSFREQRLDYLNYQLLEIEKLNPSSQEEEDLLKKKYLLVNLEKNQKLSGLMNDLIAGTESQSGLHEQMRLLVSIMGKNKDILEEFLAHSSEIQDKLLTLSSDLDRKFNQEVDQEELEGVLDRLDLYQKLKKKFGGTVETILQSQIEFLKEREQLQDLDLGLENIQKEISELKIILNKKSDELHSVRKSQSHKLSKELTFRVQDLNMKGATIKLVIDELEDFTESGKSRAYFIAETNPGEGFHKIKDIASGGELSRILLSVRQILSCYDSISIFLFDEIDTGIGGETANCIGKALKEVSTHGQVIAITHLPQIAQFSDSLIVVNKDSKESRTESYVREIMGKMIQKEVKAMAQLS